MRITLLVLALLGAHPRALAATDDAAVWLGALAQGALHGNFGAYAEAQFRAHAGNARPQTLLLRPAVRYRFGEAVSAWAGYALVQAFAPTRLIEHRLWQQGLVTASSERSFLQARFRLEQRWIGGNPVSWRWRQLVRIERRLERGRPEPALVLWDEIFVALDSGAGQESLALDQNRLFAGARVGVAERVALELGYLGVYSEPRGSQPARWSHVAACYAFLSW